MLENLANVTFTTARNVPDNFEEILIDKLSEIPCINPGSIDFLILCENLISEKVGPDQYESITDKGFTFKDNTADLPFERNIQYHRRNIILADNRIVCDTPAELEDLIIKHESKEDIYPLPIPKNSDLATNEVREFIFRPYFHNNVLYKMYSHTIRKNLDIDRFYTRYKDRNIIINCQGINLDAELQIEDYVVKYYDYETSVKDALLNSKLKYVSKIDIKEFFTNIDQNLLGKYILGSDNIYLPTFLRVLDSNYIGKDNKPNKGLFIDSHINHCMANYYIVRLLKDLINTSSIKDLHIISFLDDIVIFHNRESDTSEIISHLNKFNLKINDKKTVLNNECKYPINLVKSLILLPAASYTQFHRTYNIKIDYFNEIEDYDILYRTLTLDGMTSCNLDIIDLDDKSFDLLYREYSGNVTAIKCLDIVKAYKIHNKVELISRKYFNDNKDSFNYSLPACRSKIEGIRDNIIDGLGINDDILELLQLLASLYCSKYHRESMTSDIKVILKFIYRNYPAKITFIAHIIKQLVHTREGVYNFVDHLLYNPNRVRVAKHIGLLMASLRSYKSLEHWTDFYLLYKVFH